MRALDVEEQAVERGGRVRREEAQAGKVERAAAREGLLAERAEGVREAVLHLDEGGLVVLGRGVQVDDVEGLDHGAFFSDFIAASRAARTFAMAASEE